MSYEAVGGFTPDGVALPATGPAQDGLMAGESRKLRNWALCWLVLPNLGFMLMWAVGGPPRYYLILATGAVGLLLRRAPYTVCLIAFLAVVAISAVVFISALFNLAPGSILDSIRFLGEMSPVASPEYAAAGIVVAATIAGACQALRQRGDFRRTPALLAAITLTLALAALDFGVSYAGRSSYQRFPDAAAPFSSGVSQSGFAHGAAKRRHLVIVIVEAMGQPLDPALKRLQMGRWMKPDVQSRYRVTEGETVFYGSTTSGELRELCGRWGDYQALRDRRDPDCLPAQLRRAGYDTTSMHSFEGSFFDRTQWYPNIGIGRQRFASDLRAAGASLCPGIFPGTCDRDVPRIIADQLREAKRPQFIYWLTVNSHLPVLENELLGTEHCARFDAALNRSSPMLCRLFQLWGEVDDRLAAEIVKPDFPDADILLVGDHMPPFFDRRQRTQFSATTVPWVLLKRRD